MSYSVKCTHIYKCLYSIVPQVKQNLKMWFLCLIYDKKSRFFLKSFYFVCNINTTKLAFYSDVFVLQK